MSNASKLRSRKAVVLLSGGLDSATTLYCARAQGYAPLCLVFDYGQRHRREISAARRIARKAGCACAVLKIRLPWAGSSLLDASLPVPGADPRRLKRAGRGKEIPSTYVPARNILFLSYAVSCAEAIGAQAIFIGANALDYSGYPDCRPQFIAAFRQVIARGTRSGVQSRAVRVIAPLIDKTKAQIIRLAKKLSVPLELTWSCYAGAGAPCGTCDSCFLRARGFKEAGMEDPALQRTARHGADR